MKKITVKTLFLISFLFIIISCVCFTSVNGITTQKNLESNAFSNSNSSLSSSSSISSSASSETSSTSSDVNKKNKNYSNQWIWDNIKSVWYYYDYTGSLAKGWLVDGANTYYLDSDGKMQIGWIWDTTQSAWFYFDTSGNMCKGWIFDAGWYYLSPANGKMQTGWLNESGSTYYLNSNGKMQTGWYWDKTQNAWFFFAPSGNMYKGWAVSNSVWYFLSAENGKMITGWITQGNSKYYLKNDGSMAVGWQWIDDTASWYFFNVFGDMRTAWLLDNGTYYYLDADSGKMHKRWLQIGQDEYYLDDVNGALKIGTFVVNGVSFITDDTGRVIGQVNSDKLKGIDVSQWQGNNIDWNAVKASGVEFVMIRSNYGWTGKDLRFDQNISGAKAAGLKVGVYIYSYATNTDEAVLEYNNLMSTISGYTLDYPVAYDLEDACQKELSVSQMTDIAVTFCNLVRNSGYNPMIYASMYWMRDKLNYSSISDYQLWVAQYNTTCDYPYRNPPDMWQHTSTGSVDGISGNVDMNWDYIF